MIDFLDSSLLFGISAKAVFSFAVASFLIELTPGPNMTYLAIVAAGKGRRYGFATVLGVALGLSIIGVAAALGVTAIITSSTVVYEILRWSGIAFLLYLAWEGWRGETTQEQRRDTQGLWTCFQRGLITNLLNPKAAAFYVTVLPAFLPLEANLRQSLFLTFVFVFVATMIHALIVVLAGNLSKLLINPKREEIFRRFLSVLLAGVALWFAFETSR